MNGLKTLSLDVALGAIVVVLGAAAPAEAAIVNLSATAADGGSTVFVFDPGVLYTLEWIGVADGGLYDAWNADCVSGACDNGWTNAFSLSIDFGPDPEFSTVFLPGPGAASAPASLAAHQGATTLSQAVFSWNGSAYVVTNTVSGSPPLQIRLSDDTSVRFFLHDPDGNYANNFGGVSLRFTPETAVVPEPAAWGLMIAGFGLAGATLRRRRGLGRAAAA